MKNKTNGLVQVGLVTASSLVIASMIGTGVFTSLGFQVVEIKSIFPLLMLWIVGGIIALCGALTYSELGAALPRSGGEYNLLSKIYHPSLGFLAGWVSATVGFAGPAALAAMALGSYLKTVFPGLPADHTAAIAVILFSLIHGSSIDIGSLFQNFFTLLKVALILVFLVAAFFVEIPQDITILPQSGDWELLTSPYFAVSLVYVSYAYTGWNASIYIVGEIKNPRMTLARSLLLGTMIVMVLYILLNFVFLYTVPLDALSGQVEVGFLSGTSMFGASGGKIMSLAIAVLLVSTVSAYIFLGPRITMVMGEDFAALKWLSVKNNKGIPVNSFYFQLMIALIFIYTSSFDQVLIYASFLLILITTLTVAGIFVLRIRQPNLPRPYKAWGYPFTPLIFLVVSVWTLTFVIIDKTFESLIGIGILITGLVIYFITDRKIRIK
ncbi:MAG: amino acid permease [Bacteroidetes bacterium]|nr:amino acid permease [Bacteroidota bacterium]